MPNAGRREKGPKCGSLPLNVGELAALHSIGSSDSSRTVRTVLAVLPSELELLELSRPKCELPEAAEVKWRGQMLRSLWTFLLVLVNTCGDHRLGKHQKKRHLELIAVTFLARSSQKPKSKALVMFEQTTTS